MTICRQCGTRNPDDAQFCSACGAPLLARDDSEPTIIDVSDGDSEVIIEGQQDQPFASSYIGRTRVYVAQGSNRGCLIPIAVVLLLVCCACIGWWTVWDSIF